MPLLQLISTSTLLLWGKQDTLIPFTNFADDTRAIARSRRVALVGVAHLAREEAPKLSLPPVRERLLQKQ